MDRSAGVNLVLLLLFVQGSWGFFSLPSPWGYRCDSTSNTCIKEERTGVSGHTTLSECKLTCSPYGALFPKPTSVTMAKEVVRFVPTHINTRITAHPEIDFLLDEAILIFKDNINRYHLDYAEVAHDKLWDEPFAQRSGPHILTLDITISGMETSLTLQTDESYSLTIMTKGTDTTATIIASTFFGARHALETLSQLIAYDEISNKLMVVSNAMITDSPVYPYRGLLLDTSRNFFSVDAIKRTLDGMAANKLNTFHWHITDSHSFPLYMESLPKMVYYGAYSSRQIYYPTDVKEIIDYARVRGIRVLPEFDAPAHVGNGFQWGPHQGLGNLAVCVNREPWQSYCVEPPCGQLNLANPNMYEVLSKIYEEFVKLFGPLDLFHYGGDEVNLNCWNTTDEVKNWMTENNYGLDEDAYYRQWSVFQEKAQQLFLQANKNQKVPGIIWTSHLTEAGHVDRYLSPEDYIIQIWTTGVDPLIGELLNKKYRVIFSNYDHWYLDCGFGAWVGEGNNWCSPYKGWQAVYDNNPLKIAANLTTTLDPSLVLGGEAGMWSEQVDDQSLDSRLWPRVAALGERLWSNPDHNWEPAEYRLIHQRQRLVERGIQADRIQPQWCHQNEGLCYIKS